eukprot:CAMPEP_0117669346 /NCGR_PEP_ID=MMETSP0804-20121206/12080_1 /TAXON_ID=1074897 /ORGANISM="Tetraselmis astigmatica, Strain CCMP880" /LENGTH=749 /DNA_ID=CAMNT_0005477391 /DNA_START=78 /DNA_END=2327 /DNA_ORIENTATION=+
MADEDGDCERETLRIMISTDNHLGVYENDPVRKNDSFEAFEEVLQKAVETNSDMVLLGGDLFHENKPSRSTIVNTMRILKKYCLNDKPVSFQVLSDQAVNFPSVGRVNYEDPNVNIGLPIFTIHGNHDDPAGEGHMSAVEILSECSLVNYFGNADLDSSSIGKLSISPILLQKGETCVCLYGLGNIRDERLARLFKTPGSVEWQRPESDPTSDMDWFNLFVIHQNRERRGPKNFVDESCLPPFLDMVIWGHEHECIPNEQKVSNSECGVLQAGSTVATSLSEGEAKPKHCFLFEVRGAKYRFIKHRLETVRPFAYSTVSLKANPDLDPEDPKGLENFLEEHVSGLRDRVLMAAPPNNPMLPLVRLKVDYTGFSTINVQRFGQQFVGKVANPKDILVFSKAAQRKSNNQTAMGEEELDTLSRPEQLDQSKIEDLIAENLGPGESLEILVEEELHDALHKFVDKDDTHALDKCVKETLEHLQASVHGSGRSEEEVAKEIRYQVERLAAKALYEAKEGDTAGGTEREFAAVPRETALETSRRPSAPTSPAPAPGPPPSTQSPAKRPRAAAEATAAEPGQSTLVSLFKRRQSAAPSAAQSSRASPSSAAVQRSTAAAAQAEDPMDLTQTSRARLVRDGAGRKRVRRVVLSDEDSAEEVDDSDEDVEEGLAPQTRQTRSRQAAVQRRQRANTTPVSLSRRQAPVAPDDDDDDVVVITSGSDDDGNPVPPSNRRGTPQQGSLPMSSLRSAWGPLR